MIYVFVSPKIPHSSTSETLTQ